MFLPCGAQSLGPANARFVNFEREWPEEFRPGWMSKTAAWISEPDQGNSCRRPAPGQTKIFGLDICTLATGSSVFSPRQQMPRRQASIIWIDGSNGKLAIERAVGIMREGCKTGKENQMKLSL